MKQHWMKTFLLTAALLGTPSVAKADLVTDWNTIAISTVAGDSVPIRQSRDMAMVHAAMFDAMNGIRAQYTPAMVSVHGKGYASREAAGAQAVHDVLVALFHIEGSMIMVNRLARTLIAQEPVRPQRHAAAEQLLAHARLFAALTIAQSDTYIRTWRSKYRNLFWRPYTAIRSTFPVFSTWTPLRQTPCHPEFFAAHGTVTPAGITALQNYFGDAVNVDVTSTSLAGVTRHYNSLEQIIQAVNGARIWAGFHYRSTLVRSNVLGRTVANWVNFNLMQPLGHYDDEGEDNDGHYQGQGQSVN